MRSGRLIGLSVLALVLAVGAVGPVAESQQEDVLTIAFDASNLTTGDPHLAAATQDRAVADMVFNGLIRYKPGDITEFQPELATDWEVSEDRTTWTFNLREGITCHNGEALTAEDVVFSFRKAADSETSAFAGEYEGMSFTAVDEGTVQIELEEGISRSLFLPKVADLAGGYIVCKDAVQERGDDFATNPVGTGPFMVEEFTPQQRMVLTKNTGYFRGEPKLDRVVVRFMPSVSARESGLETGELDVIEGIPEQPWVEKMRPMSGTNVDVFGPGETVTLHFNMTRSPLGDIRVRQALAHCISRDTVRTAIGEDVTTPLYSPVPQSLAGGMSRDEVAERGLLYEPDRERARQLLEEAGFPDGFSFSARMVVSERATYRRPMQNLQSQLSECGINLDLNVVDHSTMHTKIREDVNSVVLYIAFRPNADAFLSQFYHSDSIVVAGESPITNFSHLGGVDADGDGEVESVDSLINQAETELDAEEQERLWKEAQTEILDLAVAHPLYVKQFVFARSPSVNYGHDLNSTLDLYPQIKWDTTLE